MNNKESYVQALICSTIVYVQIITCIYIYFPDTSHLIQEQRLHFDNTKAQYR